MIQKITKGDTIGLITPSSPLFPGRLEQSIKYFEQQGYKVKTGKHNYKSDRFLAGTDEERAEDVMTFFADPEVSALIVTGGGAGSVRLLPLLDYEVIKKNPKPIVGFSDTTSLQNGIYAKTGLVAYTGFSCRDAVESDSLDKIISNSLDNCLSKNSFTISSGETVNSGMVNGILVGGNLMCLNLLTGTSYQPDYRNMILLFEEVWLEPYVVDGLISQLYLAGIFEQISGLIIGQFKNCESRVYPERDGTIDDVIRDWSKKIKVPCIRNFLYSHYDSRYVLPIGVNVALDATNCKLSIYF